MASALRLSMPMFAASSLALLVWAGAISAQSTTNCQTFGNRTQCSTMPDQTQQTNQAASNLGSAIGSILAKKKKQPEQVPMQKMPTDIWTGNGFLANCDERPGMVGNYWLCAGYIQGFLGRDSLSKPSICFPPEVNNKQIHDVVIEHIRSNPAERHSPISVLVFVSLAKAFPCSASVTNH